MYPHSKPPGCLGDPYTKNKMTHQACLSNKPLTIIMQSDKCKNTYTEILCLGNFGAPTNLRIESLKCTAQEKISNIKPKKSPFLPKICGKNYLNIAFSSAANCVG